MTGAGLGWLGIVRLGLVQAAIGSIVMLSTSLLNRVMVVEYALPASLPAALVAWHYAVQLSRPSWGHGSDRGGRRTPWIILGMAGLTLGALLAINAVALLGNDQPLGYLAAIIAFTMIGAGVGAAGTSLLALLATSVLPERRAAAAAITWIMMVAGIVVSAAVAGQLIDPFSFPRLAIVAGGIACAALILSLIAVRGIERKPAALVIERRPVAFTQSLQETLADPEARRFTAFIFLSMLAYSMQDLILEPFAGLVFGYTPGQSTSLSGIQHGGVLAGMIAVGIGASAFGGRSPKQLRRWIVGGCLGSALALAGLSISATAGTGWPLALNVATLGLANGIFAVAAIGAMMGLAGGGEGGREGIRMGVWGAAQAIAFGLGGLFGAIGLDAGRALLGSTPDTFSLVFGIEAALFVGAASLALRVTAGKPAQNRPQVELA